MLICEQLAHGFSLRRICSDESMPGITTVYRWFDAHPEFRKQYVRAREDQADTLADEIVAISDEQAEVVKEDGSTFDPDVARDRLRVDARKWVASKLKPGKYGDKLELGSDPSKPLLYKQIEDVIVDPRETSQERL